MRLIIGLLLLGAQLASAQTLPIFDLHLHYNRDTSTHITPQQAVEQLKKAGISKALISSTDDDQTQRLLAIAPDLLLPALRPYRNRGELRTWMHDPSVIEYLESRLKHHEYWAMGEFHAFGNDILTPVAQQMIALARKYNLILHHHGDRQALELIYQTWPQARVIWAHAGFEEPQDLPEIFAIFPSLWADLSMRNDIHTWGGFSPDWENVFLSHSDRFLLGTDTYTSQRWESISLYTQDAQEWLNLLPKPVAIKIAFQNAADLLETE